MSDDDIEPPVPEPSLLLEPEHHSEADPGLTIANIQDFISYLNVPARCELDPDAFFCEMLEVPLSQEHRGLLE